MSTWHIAATAVGSGMLVRPVYLVGGSFLSQLSKTSQPWIMTKPVVRRVEAHVVAGVAIMLWGLS